MPVSNMTSSKTEPAVDQPDIHPIRILVLAANPRSTERLRLDEEVRSIEEKIRVSKHRTAVQIISRWAVRIDDVLQALLEMQPDVVHFSGHGTKTREIILQHEFGDETLVDREALAELFRVLKDQIRVVVLNACYSRDQAEAVAEHIDCTIGMNDQLLDDAAVEFAAAFYQAIGFGRSVHTAFELGVGVLKLKKIEGATVPELISRKGVNPREVVLVNPLELPNGNQPNTASTVIKTDPGASSIGSHGVMQGSSEPKAPQRRRTLVLYVTLAVVAVLIIGVPFGKFLTGYRSSAQHSAGERIEPAHVVQPNSLETSANEFVTVPSQSSVLPIASGTNTSDPPPKSLPPAPVQAGPPSLASTSPAQDTPLEATSGSAECVAGTCTLHAGTGVFSSAFSVCLDAEVFGVMARCMIAGNPRGVRSVICYQSDKAASRAPFQGTTTWKRCSR